MDHLLTPTRDSATKTRAELTRLKKRNDVALEIFRGRIRELDLDKLSFTLREVSSGRGEVLLKLDDEQMLEVAREALNQGQGVRVAARSQDRKLWTASDIAFVTGETTPEA